VSSTSAGERAGESAAEPIALFAEAFERARQREPFEPNAMTLATVDERGRPSARVVLLKSFDARGFVFHTNRTSRKGRELDGQKVAALCFHWPKGEEQVRVEGAVERISDEESDAYFASRPRGSQLGAWASLQSQELASREVLVARVAEMERRFQGAGVPRPPHWGGYRVVPDLIELWRGHADRLHDRRVFRRDLGPPPSAWTEVELFP
jgi:pyridoxamine 5'-phosphate oxidase